jgi:NAD(P)-dependent dehydrogenase (short-subunit alcohol dehydrogenase family)
VPCALPALRPACLLCSVVSYGRLDYCFNNAGIEGDVALTADLSTDSWDKVSLNSCCLQAHMDSSSP